MNNILLTFGARPGIRLWKNATGKARSFDGKRIIAYGLPGSPDIIGVGPGGQFIGIEVKTGSAVRNKNQVLFADALNSLGAKVFVVSSLEEVELMFKNV